MGGWSLNNCLGFLSVKTYLIKEPTCFLFSPECLILRLSCLTNFDASSIPHSGKNESSKHWMRSDNVSSPNSKCISGVCCSISNKLRFEVSLHEFNDLFGCDVLFAWRVASFDLSYFDSVSWSGEYDCDVEASDSDVSLVFDSRDFDVFLYSEGEVVW